MESDKKHIKRMSLEELKDRDLGKVGTPERDQYEFDLQLEYLGNTVKSVRESKNLTQKKISRVNGGTGNSSRAT